MASGVDKAIRVLVVDDHPIVRRGLCTMLSKDAGIEVVGEAGTGPEAIEKARELEIDVVLTDISMPGMSGLELIRRLKQAQPHTAVVVITVYDSQMYLIETLRAGAAGYVVKDSSEEVICRAVKAAVEGLTTARSDLLLSAIRGGGPVTPISEQSGLRIAELTARELDVLRLVARGYLNKEIAKDLSLAEVTVKKYVQAVMAKLRVSDRTNAAIVAVRLGLVE